MTIEPLWSDGAASFIICNQRSGNASVRVNRNKRVGGWKMDLKF